jgi:predicted membrane protein
MEENEKRYRRSGHRIWGGLFVVVIGVLLLARQMDAGVPDWIFTWPTLLIGIGVVIGFQHGFRNISWIFLIAAGSFLLVDHEMPELRLHRYIYPIMVILLGVFFIFRRHNRDAYQQRQEWKNSWRNNWRNTQFGADISSTDGEFIDSTSVFGGVKKIILSKNFKGGDITCFMGGAEIDLSQADIQGSAALDITQVFGGTKLIVPGNWNIKTQIISVFAGIEDKRMIQSATPDINKTLILDGTSVFGGIEITSYPTKLS